jgi:hypothetical protein
MDHDTEFLLNQAFEESRYYRHFYHTVFTLFVTFYLVLLGAQLSYPDKMKDMRVHSSANSVVFLLLLFIGVPIWIVYVFLKYHKRIANLNALIAVTLKRKQIDLQVSGLENQAAENFQRATGELFLHKYSLIITRGLNPLTKGTGHWFFISTLLAIVLCNIALFFR